MHVVERLAEFAQIHRGRPIAPQVLHHAKRAVIDWHAALFPGARVAPATALERALAEELDHGDAHLALAGERRYERPRSSTARLRTRSRWTTFSAKASTIPGRRPSPLRSRSRSRGAHRASSSCAR